MESFPILILIFMSQWLLSFDFSLGLVSIAERRLLVARRQLQVACRLLLVARRLLQVVCCPSFVAFACSSFVSKGSSNLLPATRNLLPATRENSMSP